ncbi:hypothetical protein ZHAS_00005552 [Anopheles sinensis]|uniref:Uncharacterized protein n=1 Tax=Anopheles sinensis TaxID=74873 RepID=A0A084VJQ6_ANOSI|nr:hypothetical protein ZHAS_00005552 [Anopheles sinensis]
MEWKPFIAKHPELTDSFNNRLIYYTRTRGLFRYCYPKERPPASSGKCDRTLDTIGLKH